MKLFAAAITLMVLIAVATLLALGYGWWPIPFGFAVLCTVLALQPIPLDTATRTMRRDTQAAETLNRLANETELQRSVFDVSADLVGCLDLEDALNRFSDAVRTWWHFDTLECWLWEKGHWICLGDHSEGISEPAVLTAPVQLPHLPEQQLVLDLSPAVHGQAQLLAHGAIPQPTISSHSDEDRRAVAEVLLGQLALALRRVMLYRDLQDLARTDPLTSCARRWYGEQRLREQLLHSDVCIALIDIDHFKRINDTYGHQTGDAVLQAVGEELMRQLRPVDVVTRQGGEEFVVMLPATAQDEAFGIINRLRTGVRTLPFNWGAVTFSAGLTLGRRGEDPQAVIERADQACYAAKNAGRDRVANDYAD